MHENPFAKCLVLLALLSGPAQAYDCTLPQARPDGNVVALLVELRTDGCLGGGRDTAPIVARTAQELAAIQAAAPAGAGAVRTRAATALAALDRSLTDAAAAMPLDWNHGVASIRERIAAARAEVADPQGEIAATLWEPFDLDYFEGRLSLAPPLEAACASGRTPACDAAQRHAGVLIRHATLVRAVLDQAATLLVTAPKSRAVAAIDAQWVYYFEHGRPQYVWELAINSALYRPAQGTERFSPPPAGQWIVLHPTAAVEYAPRQGDRGRQFNAVALVEVIGYNRLRYASDDRRAGTFGASLIATISPESAGRRVGWGALVHLGEHVSIGAARRDLGRGTATTWLVSVDLARWLGAPEAQARTAFRRRDPQAPAASP